MPDAAAIAAQLSPAQRAAVQYHVRHGYTLNAPVEKRAWATHKATARALEGLGVLDVERRMVTHEWYGGLFGRGNLRRREVCELGTSLTDLGCEVARYLGVDVSAAAG